MKTHEKRERLETAGRNESLARTEGREKQRLDGRGIHKKIKLLSNNNGGMKCIGWGGKGEKSSKREEGP